jgi:predicted dehydrogenase
MSRTRTTPPDSVFRRDFLKAASAAAGSAVLAGPLVLCGEEGGGDKLNLAVIGLGGQGRGDMKGAVGAGARVVALCDPDETMLGIARKEAAAATAGAKDFTDYRRLFDEVKTFDAVLIATPDHWHAPLCTFAMKAGKHAYCEKPLTHTVAEARALRELARASKVATQMGNQGSASGSLRRALELIRAGALGEIREVHAWLGHGGPGKDRPQGEDPLPAGFNWDCWLGPSPVRPYKKGEYHPYNWRNWYDFGNGTLADFGCHIFNLPHRALELTYPVSVDVSGEGLAKDSYSRKCRVTYQFPARGAKPPVTLFWYDGGERPPADILQPVAELGKNRDSSGCLLVGEKGIIYTNPWNDDDHILLKDEPKLVKVQGHEATKSVPETLPRGRNHMQEWVQACKGGQKPFSDFDTGGHLTEIVLTGVVALRAGKKFDWDGEKMKSPGVPETAPFVRAEWRKTWML